MKLSEENPHKYFVLSRYSHKSQQYGIFVVSEVGNLDMEAKNKKDYVFRKETHARSK